MGGRGLISQQFTDLEVTGFRRSTGASSPQVAPHAKQGFRISAKPFGERVISGFLPELSLVRLVGPQLVLRPNERRKGFGGLSLHSGKDV